MLHWRRGFAFVSTENGRMWTYSRLIEIEFYREIAPENPGCMHKEINLERLQDR